MSEEEEDIYVKYDDGKLTELDGDIEIIPDDPTKERMVLKRIGVLPLPNFMRVNMGEDMAKLMKDLDWFFDNGEKE